MVVNETPSVYRVAHLAQEDGQWKFTEDLPEPAHKERRDVVGVSRRNKESGRVAYERAGKLSYVVVKTRRVQ